MKTKMKFAIIIVVAILTQSCSNQKTENDWTRDGLQGKVLSFSEFSYEAEERFGQIEKGNRKRKDFWENDVQYKYDEKGNKIEENRYESDGSLDNKWTYKYEFDKQGNWIKRIDFENKIAKFILEREYEYYK